MFLPSHVFLSVLHVSFKGPQLKEQGNITGSEMKNGAKVSWEECNDVHLWMMLRRNNSLALFLRVSFRVSIVCFLSDVLEEDFFAGSYWFFMSLSGVSSISSGAY